MIYLGGSYMKEKNYKPLVKRNNRKKELESNREASIIKKANRGR